MSEKLLHRAKVAATAQEIRCERMAKHVWMHSRKSGDCRVLLDQLPNRNSLKRLSAHAHEEAKLRAPFIRLHETRARFLQPSRNPTQRVLADRNHAVLRPFAHYMQCTSDFAELIQSQRPNLGRTQSTCVHRFENRAIAKPEITVLWQRRLDEFAHVARRKHVRQFLPPGWALEQSRRIVGEFLGRVEIAKEHAHGDDMSSDAVGIKRALRREPSHMFEERFWSHGCNRGHAACAQIDEEVTQITLIRFKRQLCETSFNFEMREETPQRCAETLR